MVAPVFREPAFVWACVALTGVCALAALAVWQRKFLLGLSEQLIRLPPSGKAVLATAVVVATVFAQKPANVSTDTHGLARIEEGVSAMPTEKSAHPPAKQPEGAAMRGAPNTEGPEERRHGEGGDVLDRIYKIDRIVEAGASSPPNSVNPVNPVKETPCLRVSV